LAMLLRLSQELDKRFSPKKVQTCGRVSSYPKSNKKPLPRNAITRQGKGIIASRHHSLVTVTKNERASRLGGSWCNSLSYDISTPFLSQPPLAP
jgi:hypothetical protein